MKKTIFINNHFDFVNARMRGREIARQMGFNLAGQARISLAVSELARIFSQNGDYPGEIVLADTCRDGQQGLLIACLVTLGQLPLEDRSEWSKNGSGVIRSLAGACRLVDESIVKAQNNQRAWVILTQWHEAR